MKNNSCCTCFPILIWWVNDDGTLTASANSAEIPADTIIYGDYISAYNALLASEGA